MIEKFNIIFLEWRNKTAKLMFPEVINPICFVEKKISKVACIAALLILEILIGILIVKINIYLTLLIIAHSIAVLISTTIWKQPAKNDFSMQDVGSITLKHVVAFNFARGVYFIWFSAICAAYLLLMPAALFFPLFYGIYLYAIHIFLIALYIYMKEKNLNTLNALTRYADNIFTLILYLLSGCNLPFVSMCESGRAMIKFGIKRR